MKHRGGFGVICHNITEKTGLLAGILSVDDNDDIMIITDAGTLIRTHVASIPVHGRATGGVIVMRLSDDAKIVNFARVEKEEEIAVSEEEEAEAAPTEGAPTTEAPAEEAPTAENGEAPTETEMGE